MSNIKINFWGTRGSCPGFDNKSLFYGGNTTCVSIDYQSDITIVLDAGTGISKCGQNLLNTHKDILLLLTHLHWDHIQGFPFFAPIYFPRDIYFYSALPKSALGYCAKQMDTIGHPLSFSMLPSSIKQLNLNELEDKFPIKLTSIQTRHPGTCYAYALNLASQKIVFMPDNQLHSNESTAISNKDLQIFCSNADILIHDAQYSYADMPQKKDWGHSIFEDAVHFAIDANVKKLFLFHHDPSRSDSEIDYFVKRSKDIVENRKSKLSVYAAYDGLSILA